MADVKDVKKVNKREFLKKYHKANKALEMWRIFKSNRLAVVGLLIFIVILLLMIFANVIADYKTVAIATNLPYRKVWINHLGSCSNSCRTTVDGLHGIGVDIIRQTARAANT